MSRFWNWLLSLFKKEYEVTVWFEGSTFTTPDGTKEVRRDPKRDPHVARKRMQIAKSVARKRMH